jgi:hypothetical protein
MFTNLEKILTTHWSESAFPPAYKCYVQTVQYVTIKCTCRTFPLNDVQSNAKVYTKDLQIPFTCKFGVYVRTLHLYIGWKRCLRES